ncbi:MULTISPECIES: hypothetical protein [Marinobacter]|uniref:Uncharacterized protein n=1 Tax=Marinobacter metalliresistant TaxID=2961995 RepID=A0ABZ2VXK2_9GAMM|nr:hypothetical protein [Marinobacter sp. Arc7-DN-1]AXS83596.1 hypothetical protein D0851_11440 [Marinobacter sp. Arc7-DN-1]
MECPDISSLKLDRADEEALEEIRRAQRAGSLLEVVMPAGVMATIFLGNNAAQATYNIHSTDWVLFAHAMSTLPDMIRARVSQVAKIRILTGSLSYEQRQFWDAVDNGCGGY